MTKHSPIHCLVSLRSQTPKNINVIVIIIIRMRGKSMCVVLFEWIRKWKDMVISKVVTANVHAKENERDKQRKRGEREMILCLEEMISSLAFRRASFDSMWFGFYSPSDSDFFSLSIRAIYSIYKLCCCPAAMSGLLIVFHSH